MDCAGRGPLESRAACARRSARPEVALHRAQGKRAASVIDRLAVLDKGEVVAVGTIDEVFDDPSHPYVQALAGALDAGHAVIDDLQPEPPA